MASPYAIQDVTSVNLLWVFSLQTTSLGGLTLAELSTTMNQFIVSKRIIYSFYFIISESISGCRPKDFPEF